MITFSLQARADQLECYGPGHPVHAGPESRRGPGGHGEQPHLPHPARLRTGHAWRYVL